MDWMADGLVVLFFWGLIGQYVYREAIKESRSSPVLRAVFWGVFGSLGAITLLRGNDYEKTRLGWLGFSMVLIVLWAVGSFDLWGLNGGYYLWASLFASGYILYWQFDLEIGENSQQTGQ